MIVCRMVSVTPAGLITTNTTLNGAEPIVAVNSRAPASATQINGTLTAILPAGVGFTVMVTALDVALHCGVVTTLL